ncbi:dihydrolipoamide acetyltransferase family protein [Pelolinea submarina]|uniref:Dihydrolipoamide acetyltransferase component of pyruvate dehydrogenase complex n=1 Tax=Pelolinea submarina TaxID=913107 RepID=A0A347ZQY9_9CHLR|nr:dihydrolipoamide acetyltransferase family protein [Pelolinea submarina]REG11726.1 2-oxoglutarate dehydrogenase E2 component [Pelolinea submarina]BBB47720.1 pyruvate dehydrogenase E2 component, dihydrolipoamide acetyltransferase [Pelolinea submarina]
MATKILLPRLGESIEEAVIGKWCKEIGETVARGDVIAELETAKAMMELESPAKGVLLALIPEIGQTVQMGELVAVVGKEGEDWQAQFAAEEAAAQTETAAPVEDKAQAPSTGMSSPATEKHSDVRIAPNAKRVADDLGIDWTQIPLEDGVTRITSEMVKAFAKSRQGAPAGGGLPGKRVALTKVQSITAKRMTESTQNIPQFSVSMDVEADSLKAFVQAQKDKGEARVTVTAVLIQKVAAALVEHPRLNARFDAQADAVLEYTDVNIAIATATPEGLFVPVLHNVPKMGIAQIASGLAALAEDARGGKLKYEDSVGATFTISNLGMKGVSKFTPIIDPSQSAILGVGGMRSELALDADGKVISKKIMNLTVTADHRAVDGMAVAEFLVTLKNLLQNL